MALNIQARVVESFKELVDSGVDELRSRLDSTFPIVGFDLKKVKLSESQQMINTFTGYGNRYAHAGGVVNSNIDRGLLVLYVKDLCLVLKLETSQQPYCSAAVNPHDSVWGFLKDKSICFLGWEVSKKVNLVLPSYGNSIIMNCVKNVGSLAARVLKIRELERCFNLVDLASKVGGDAATAVKEDEASRIMKEAIEIPCNKTINDVCFTEDEVKYAVLDAYRCYTIGTQLMTIYKS